MDVAEFRCPTALRVQAQQQADREGTSFSEFVRGSLALRLAWIAALDAVAAGVPAHSLTNIEEVTRMLARISDAPPP
jgi:hypothetical protein